MGTTGTKRRALNFFEGDKLSGGEFVVDMAPPVVQMIYKVTLKGKL